MLLSFRGTIANESDIAGNNIVIMYYNRYIWLHMANTHFSYLDMYCWVSGIVLGVSGLVLNIWVSGLVFWVSGLVFWVLYTCRVSIYLPDVTMVCALQPFWALCACRKRFLLIPSEQTHTPGVLEHVWRGCCNCFAFFA